MGYTHYWERPGELPRPQFAAAAQNCRTLCAALEIPLVGAEGSGQPVFTAELVCVNGANGASCETFHVPRVQRPRRSFDRQTVSSRTGFCKTNHMPYDLCVQGCLIVLRHHLGGPSFRVSSDGRSQDWNAAREACQRVLGYGIDWGEDKLAPVPPQSANEASNSP
jgi:hypothetical protein